MEMPVTWSTAAMWKNTNHSYVSGPRPGRGCGRPVIPDLCDQREEVRVVRVLDDNAEPGKGASGKNMRVE